MPGPVGIVPSSRPTWSWHTLIALAPCRSPWTDLPPRTWTCFLWRRPRALLLPTTLAAAAASLLHLRLPELRTTRLTWMRKSCLQIYSRQQGTRPQSAVAERGLDQSGSRSEGDAMTPPAGSPLVARVRRRAAAQQPCAQTAADPPTKKVKLSAADCKVSHSAFQGKHYEAGIAPPRGHWQSFLGHMQGSVTDHAATAACVVCQQLLREPGRAARCSPYYRPAGARGGACLARPSEGGSA